MLSQKHAIVAKNRIAPVGFGSAVSLRSLLKSLCSEADTHAKNRSARDGIPHVLQSLHTA